MTHQEVMTMLAEMNLPYAYDHFIEGESPDPPFLVFLYPGSNHFAEIDVVNRRIKYVYDFDTAEANGTIASVALTHAYGGYGNRGTDADPVKGLYPFFTNIGSGLLEILFILFQFGPIMMMFKSIRLQKHYC